MKKILLAMIIGLVSVAHADTVCNVTKIIPTYKTELVKTHHLEAYQVQKVTNIQCGVSLVDVPNTNTMKEVPKYCSSVIMETKHRGVYTYDNVTSVTKYTNYFRYLGKQYIKESSRPLNQVIVR